MADIPSNEQSVQRFSGWGIAMMQNKPTTEYVLASDYDALAARLKIAPSNVSGLLARAVELLQLGASSDERSQLRKEIEAFLRSPDETTAPIRECPYCKRPVQDGSIFHEGTCAGLEDVVVNRLQYDRLVARASASKAAAPRAWTEEHRLLIERIFPENGHQRCACGLNMPHPYAAGICAPDWRPKHEVNPPPEYVLGYLSSGSPSPQKAADGECQHDLLRPDTTIEVIDPWKAKCKVCITFFDLPGRPAQKTSVPLCDPKCFDYPRCECGRRAP